MMEGTEIKKEETGNEKIGREETNKEKVYETEAYRQVILSFESQHSYKNPFMDCLIEVIFQGPSGRKIVREAYWDGENTYRVAFAPTEIGAWEYCLTAPEETGLNGVKGSVECVPYEGNLEIYRHGFLKISNDKRYFTYADGTPFFWLGDTHWEFCYREKWDESNYPEMDSMFKGMIDRRVRQGYTIYQTNLRSDKIMGGEAYYWEKPGVPNVKFYQEELDRRMYYLADQGIVNALGFAWFMSIENQVETYQQLARYIIARYGALPMVWTLAGEVGGYDKAKQPFYVDEWRKVALLVQKLDSYHHPRTAHYTNERPFPSYYQKEEWFDFTLNQAGHGDYVVSMDDYKGFLEEYGNKPFVEGEALYEFCSTLEENGTRMCTDAMLRRVAYMTMQAGGCGYTYGAQGIWDVYYEKGQKNPMAVFNRFEITWHEAIDGPGGYQMGYFRQFYEDQKFWELYPYQAEKDAAGDPFGKKLPFITVSEDRKHWVFYYSESTRKSGIIQEIPNGSYTMQWFNPRTGEYETGKTEFTVEDNTWKIPSKPDLSDWCLVIKEKQVHCNQ